MGQFTSKDLVNALETAGVKLATQEVMTYLTLNVWAGFGLSLINPIVGYLVSVVVGILFLQVDWVAFTMTNGWMTTQEGKNFMAAVQHRVSLPAAATAQEIKDAEQAQIYCFRNLVKLNN